MKIIAKSLITLISFLVAFCFLSSTASAATIPYTITTGIPADLDKYLGATFFEKDFTLNYQSGYLVLSSNPDGSGYTQVDDAIEITVTRPDQTINKWHFSYQWGCMSVNSYWPQNITNPFSYGENKVHIRLYDECGWYSGSSPLYIVNMNAPEPTPTPTPIPTPTPVPTPTPTPAPSPFLDLPWDYVGKGLSFNEAANAINSYFDHEYPLLSSGIREPSIAVETTTTFKGEFRTRLEYSSHDGYDYGIPAKVNIGDAVLAAASGWATYHYDAATIGNAIFINHDNGYETRYFHMLGNSTIIKDNTRVWVNKGQEIGKVGATGHVIPGGDAGAHIHFMVVQDKNKDGNFDDNIPDGVTDPFGWQSKDPDPWENYTFLYYGQNKTGNKSYYLWTKKLDNLDFTLTSNGGVFKTERYSLDFPNGSTNQNLNINILSSPIIKVSNALSSIGSTIMATAKDLLGNTINQFDKLFTITVDFSAFDLSRYKTDTISLYSSQDGINWDQIPTIVDMNNKSASAQVNHFTHFALMAERADIIPPVTTAVLSGQKGQENWFRSDVEVQLNAQDNDGGLGVDYTLYKIGDEEWQQYNTPVSFTTEGHYKISFYSVDKDENIEDLKSIEFDIDKTLPEAQIQFDPNIQDLVISGNDNSGSTDVVQVEVKKNRQQIIISDKAGNSLALMGKDREHGKEAKLSLESLRYNEQPEIELGENKFHVEYSLDKDKEDVKKLKQEFEIEDKEKIELEYSSKTNITKIKIEQDDKEEQKDGIILLKLYTEKGTLKYSYY